MPITRGPAKQMTACLHGAMLSSCHKERGGPTSTDRAHASRPIAEGSSEARSAVCAAVTSCLGRRRVHTPGAHRARLWRRTVPKKPETVPASKAKSYFSPCISSTFYF